MAKQQLNGNQIETQQAWQSPALQNGWVNYDTATWDPVGYMKDSLGFVHIRGFIKNGTVTQGTVIFVLPSGYRPVFASYVCSGWNSNNTPAAFHISSDGAVKVLQCNATYTGIGHIVFKAEQ